MSAAQKLRIDGNCAIVTGRTFDPMLMTVGAWTPSSPFAMPSAIRSIATLPGKVMILTDHSLEILATGASPKPSRRKAAR